MGVVFLKWIFLVTMIFFKTDLVESQVQLTSPKRGVNVTKSLGSSVTFTWNFTGDLLSIIWGTKRIVGLKMDQSLLTLPKRGPPRPDNVPLYNGRVSGSWNGESPGQVSFTLNPIKEVDDRIFMFTFVPFDAGASDVKDTVQLNVQDPPKVMVVSPFLSTPRGIEAMFTCNTTGFPVPTIKWLVGSGSSGDEVIVNGGNKKVTQKSGVSELIIRNATVDDQGYYVCKASNFEFDEARVFLGVINFSKERDLCPINVTANIGETITICCPVKGFPPPQINWELPDGTLSNTGNTELRVALRTKYDFGLYRCTAKGLQKEVLKFNVTISGKTENSTIDEPVVLRPGIKFKWQEVQGARNYLLRFFETDMLMEVSLLGDSYSTSAEIPLSSLVFKDEADKKAQTVTVAIEVSAIGEDGNIGGRKNYTVVILSSATTSAGSFMTLMLSFVIYNQQ